MKTVGVIGSHVMACTDISGILYPLKNRVEIICNERKLDNVTELFCFRPSPGIIPQHSIPKIKGHQRPYKFHK